MVGNVGPSQAWEALKGDKAARLVDVRTEAEWQFVGIPDLQETGQEPVLIPWQTYPSMAVNSRFVEHLREAGLTPENRIYFLCRTGGRSMAAAQAAQAAGFGSVFNVEMGFEGVPDEHGHRGTVAGWKAEGLPWVQR